MMPAADRLSGRRPGKRDDLQPDGGDRGRVRRCRLLVEIAELALDVAAKLSAVVALEVAGLGDGGVEGVALALEAGGLLALLGLSVGTDAVDLGLRLGDQLALLGLALGDVLVVQALRQLDDAGRGRGRAGGR